MNRLYRLYHIVLILITIVTVIIAFQVGKHSEANMLPKVIVKQSPPKIVKVQPKGVIVSVTVADLERRLKTNESHLSSKQRKVILDAIMKASELYKVSPLILFAIPKVESSYRPWITHRQVIIKGKKDNAIGLTAILYSWWGKKLKKAGIIETKSDLYDPQMNILACGFVFNELRKMPLKKGTTDPNVSAMRRYFGKNFKSYSDKIEAEIGAVVFKKVYQ